MASNNTVKIQKLHSADPRCFWCERVTVINPPGVKEQTDLTATYDHLYQRDDVRRLIPHYGTQGVLACRWCNSRRKKSVVSFMKRLTQCETVV